MKRRTFKEAVLLKIKRLQFDVLPSANCSLKVFSLSESSGIQSSKCDFRISLSSIKPIPCDDQLRSLIPDAYFPSKMEHSFKCTLMVFAMLIRCFAQLVKHSWFGSLKSCAMLQAAKICLLYVLLILKFWTSNRNWWASCASNCPPSKNWHLLSEFT